MEHIINQYSSKKIKGKYLVTADQGGWAFLDEKEFELLKKNSLSPELVSKLCCTGIIVTPSNLNKITGEYKKKYSHLYCGTGLHIVVPTLRCNLKCTYCHAKSRGKEEPGFDMDEKTAKKTVDFIFQTPSKNIKIEFQGGEPLLNFEMIKYIVGYAQKKNSHLGKNISFALVTNLTYMDEEKFNFLRDNKVNVCTSLDGPKEVHDKNRLFFEGKSTHANVESWIKRFMKEYPSKISALPVITRNSLPFWKEIIDEYVCLGLNPIHLKYVSNLGYANNNWKDVGYSADEFIDFWKKSIDYIVKKNLEGTFLIERIAQFIVLKLMNIPLYYTDLQSPCGAVIGQMAYSYNGDIYSCDEGRHSEVFKIGNVKENSYKEVVNSEQACSIIASSVNDTLLCDACVWKPFCGVCPACNHAETGNLLALGSNTRCRILQGQFEYIFERFSFDKDYRKVFMSWLRSGSS